MSVGNKPDPPDFARRLRAREQRKRRTSANKRDKFTPSHMTSPSPRLMQCPDYSGPETPGQRKMLETPSCAGPASRIIAIISRQSASQNERGL
jgi:hypothetical protein